MPLVIPHTFADGTVTSSQQMQENDRAVAAFLQQLTTAELDTKPWVTSQHVVRGYFDGTRSRAVYASGLYGQHQGRNAYASSLVQKGTSGPQEVGGPCVTVEARGGATLVATWWAQAYLPSDLVNPTTDRVSFYLSVDGARQPGSESRAAEETTVATTPAWELRFLAGGFTIADLTAGDHSIQVTALTTSQVAKAHLVYYGLSYEVFYF